MRRQMADMATTRMSSKGQVVIPESIRKRLRLEPGSVFAVVGEDDTVILKTITAPDMNQFDDLVRRARAQARRAGLKQSDVTTAARKVRSGS